MLIFEDLKELEEQKTKEALELVKRKHKLVTWEGERERARMLQRLESSRAAGQPSTIPPMGRARLSWHWTQTKRCLLPPRWRKTWMWRCPNHLGLLWQRRRKRDCWSVDLEGKMVKMEVVGPWSGTEGGSMDPKAVVVEGGEAHTINLCQQCYNEKLVQQGKPRLKLRQWKGIAKKKAHRGRIWNVIGTEQFLPGMCEYFTLKRAEARKILANAAQEGSVAAAISFSEKFWKKCGCRLWSPKGCVAPTWQ